MAETSDLAAQELIPIRAEEGFDQKSLEGFLRQHLPDSSGPFRVAQFGGGHANLTYLVQFGSHDFVLRRPPLGPVAPGAHDMGREHRVLSCLNAAFPLAPRSVLYCDDASIIGAPFVVVERRTGFVIRRDLPAIFQGNAELNRRIGEMLIDVLAELHLVRTETIGLGDFGRPEGFVRRQLDGWKQRWQAALDKALPAGDAVADWLGIDPPNSPQVSLLHNDYKLDNLLLDTSDPAHCVAVLDWDMCTRGDPLLDLGYLLNYWTEPGDPVAWRDAARMPTWHDGFFGRDAAIERYAARTGYSLDRIRWYQVFGIFKLAVILQQIYIRYLRGQTHDERFAGFGRRIDLLFAKADALMTR